MNNIKHIIKRFLSLIYRSFPVQWLVKGTQILWHVYVYIPFHKSKYDHLKRFKNIHKGKRVFIVATAPSLRLEDVDKLKDEITFSMNTCYRIFDKTEWRPTYYAIFDQTVLKRIEEDIKNINFNCAFFSDNLKSYNEKINTVGLWNNWRANSKIERMIIPDSFIEKQMRISDDISKYVYAGTSVMHFIIQICFYMGFKEIYLYGADCTISNKAFHNKLVEYKTKYKLGNDPEYLNYGLMRDYERAKKYAAKHGVKIFNATRGGMLEKFERVDLDEVLKK